MGVAGNRGRHRCEEEARRRRLGGLRPRRAHRDRARRDPLGAGGRAPWRRRDPAHEHGSRRHPLRVRPRAHTRRLGRRVGPRRRERRRRLARAPSRRSGRGASERGARRDHLPRRDLHGRRSEAGARAFGSAGAPRRRDGARGMTGGGALDSSVTLEEVFTVIGSRRVPLAPELAGYLVLEIAEHADPSGGEVDPKTVFVSEEGTVALVKPRREGPAGSAETSIRAMLTRLLDASGSQTPALAAAGKRRSLAGLPALAEELEIALIPVNRAAGRRALARL